MPSTNKDFAEYCCELLASAGPCVARRMFGGWGISTGGLTLALMTDLGHGDRLWLKADADSRARFEAAGCERFTYTARGVPKSMNYYSAPVDAMESQQFMAPWARLALESALKARSAPARLARPATKSKAKPAKPAVKRTMAPTAPPSARRKSPRG
ncbi:MAG: TfoX/Sxy family protein [Rhodoferax sp.]